MSPRTTPNRAARRLNLTTVGALGAATAVGLAGVPGPAQAQAQPAASADPLAALRAPGHLSAQALSGLAPSRSGSALGVAPAPQRNNDTLYTVRSGDTVGHIAARYRTSVSAIVSENNLNSRAFIRVGQVLRIPGLSGSGSSGNSNASSSSNGSSSSSSSSSAGTTHTVRAGDTVWALANRHGTTVARIISANNLNSNGMIRIGQHLSIPGSSSGSSSGGSSSGGSSSGSTGSSSGGSSSSSSGSSSNSSSSRTHTVRAGETVSHLAARYGTSVSSIVSANSLGSNALIRIGQRLTIPGSSSGSSSAGSSSAGSSSGSTGSSSGGSSSGSGNASATTYTVKAGDTLTRIGRQHNVSIGRLVSANNLTGSMIRVGQRLTIPAPTSSGDDLIPNTFLHYTYSDDVVAAANENKRTLLAMNVPSRSEMEQIVRQTARDMGVDPALALAIAHQESGFDARAVSPANAVGTMQVIPSSGLWANDMVGRNLNLLDPRDNVVAGVAILRALQRTSDDLPTAIASYYQGQGSVRNNGMYSDTRRYVASVQTLMTRFG